MPEHVPAEAGFFTVILRAQADREWCDETKEAIESWSAGMPGSEQSAALGLMPAMVVEDIEAGVADLVLTWTRQPGDGTWDAAEQIIENVGKVAFPSLLQRHPALQVTVFREEAVGRDVVLGDDAIREAEEEARQRAWLPDAPPPDL